MTRAGLAPTFCRTTLRYAAPDSGVPIDVAVDVHDGRATDLPGWRACGFELVEHSSRVEDWTDDDEIAAVHYGEMEDLARSLTGCTAALVSDHVKRTAASAKRPREQQPVPLVHSDFAPDYGDIVRTSYRDVRGRGAATLQRNGLTADDVEQAGRVMMLQFWRNLGPAKMDYPVAFCDARSVRPSETKPFPYTGYVAGGRAFNALTVLAPDDPARHQWYAFPEMTPDEVVVFRTYDSDLVESGETYFMPHSAFRDPEIEPGHPARFSIEMRVMCLFD